MYTSPRYWLTVSFLFITSLAWAQSFVAVQRGSVNRASFRDNSDAQLTVSGNFLYFIGDDSNTGRELWRTDGTPGNTRLVKDIFPLSERFTKKPSSLTDLNGTLYFVAGTQLWRTDGSEGGTMMVRDFSDVGDVSIRNTFNNLLLIDSPSSGLWRSDGTPGGTFRLTNQFQTGVAISNGNLFIVGPSGTNFQQTTLSRSDGTVAGTTLLRTFEGTMQTFGAGSDGLYITFYNGTTRVGSIWRSNGTADGTVQVAGNLSSPPPVFFNAFGELYQQDFGVGPQPIRRQNRSTGAFEAVSPTPLRDVLSFGFGALYNGQAYAPANLPGFGVELSRANGTPVRDIRAGGENSVRMVRPAVANGLLYFSADNGANGYELWQTDGTEAGTRQVGDLEPGSEGSFPMELTNFKNELYFTTAQGSLVKLSTATDPFTTLRIVDPVYRCDNNVAGEFFVQVEGGDNSPVEYRISGVRDWGTGSGFYLSQDQRQTQTLSIEVRQNGRVISRQFTPGCGLPTPPTPPVTPPAPPMPPVTPPVTPPVVGGTLTLNAPAYDCNTGQITIQVSGGNGSAIEYKAVGLRDWSLNGSFTVPSWQRTGTMFTFEVRQSGQMFTQQFTTTCNATPPTPPITPPTPPTTPVVPPTNSGSALSIDAPSYDCNTGQLTVQVSGGNGSTIEYKVMGLRDWSANNSFIVPSWQRSGTTFTLEVRQNGAILTRSFTGSCGSARLVGPEMGTQFTVELYPNPVSEQFSVGVRGAAGKAVRFDLINASGRAILTQSRHIDADNQTESLTMPAGSPDGLYLLRVSTNGQAQTVKVIKL